MPARLLEQAIDLGTGLLLGGGHRTADASRLPGIVSLFFCRAIAL
jgi:hypothetical protein